MRCVFLSAFAMAVAVSASVLGASHDPAVSSAPLTRQVVDAPLTVRRIPVTAQSKPFLADRTDLGAADYVEEEFFISGMARTYEWVGDTLGIRAVTEPGPYTTRILVRRPREAQLFSGNIEVEMLNSSTGMDVSTTMTTSADFIKRQGDVWIGVTSKPLILRTLKRFDPDRYGQLAWSNPAPEDKRCPHPSIVGTYTYGSPGAFEKWPPISFPESEDGLVWDIKAQLGAFLKSERRSEILPGFEAPKLFATGYSQSALLMRTFINAFHDVFRLPDGGPIYDGYLMEVGPGLLRINQCSKDVLPNDPRNKVKVPDVPVINIDTEAEMWLGMHTRQPDVVGQTAGLVSYELAGANHRPYTGDAGRPSPTEATRAGFTKPFLPPPKDIIVNDMPRGYLSAAALRNLQAWARTRTPPPQGQPLMIENGEIRRDADGNAVGGVRLPWIDVPTATYRGALGLGAMALVGSKTPFTPEKLRTLYPNHAAYVMRMRASTDKLVKERWLLPEAGDEIFARATAEVVP